MFDIPADDDRGTYTDRQVERHTVTERRRWDEAGGARCTINSGSLVMHCSEEVYDLLPEGKEFLLEARGFSLVTGWLIDGKWYDRKTDQELRAEHDAFLAAWEQRKQDALAENRGDWQRRQDLLPAWIRSRLEHFHERGGEYFAADGWGYELVVAELAVAYAAMGDDILGKDEFSVEDSDEVKRIADEFGTSGNQHGMALALAKTHLQDPDRLMEGTVSALSPITGDAFYDKGES